MKLKIVVIDLEIPGRVKRIALRAALLVTILVGLGAIAYASVPVVFAPHSPLNAADLNADFGNMDSRIGAIEDGGTAYAVEAKHAGSADTATGGGPGPFAVPGNLTVGGNATVAGTLSIGLSTSTNCTFDAGFTDCTCGANEVAISGGGFGGAGGAYLDESRNPAVAPGVGNVWRVGCRDSTGTRTKCADTRALCARLAP